MVRLYDTALGRLLFGSWPEVILLACLPGGMGTGSRRPGPLLRFWGTPAFWRWSRTLPFSQQAGRESLFST
ncbi:MAG: hypothetical protein HFE97_05165 [Oscillospiraceae bacterium]|nr:hypothetical protein [Oscillospiraceae bacterium]